MKNIEKYPNTNDALKAYHNESGLKKVQLEEWLELEYEEPRQLTLLEAAKEIKGLWDKAISSCQSIKLETWNDAIDRLSDAAEREGHKPVRNCDKYRTAKDAFAGFNKMCEEKKCSTCPFSAERNECLSCRFNWLFAEAEKEVSK